jgi:hypothetical protein
MQFQAPVSKRCSIMALSKHQARTSHFVSVKAMPLPPSPPSCNRQLNFFVQQHHLPMNVGTKAET